MNHLEHITNICHYLLKNFPGAKEYRNYLATRISEESIDKFKIGYFPESKYIDLLLRETKDDILLKLKLIREREFSDSCASKIIESYFEYHPLVIPYLDAYGNVVGIIGRTLLPEEERKALKLIKYKNTDVKNTGFRKGNHLYGLYESKSSILENNSVYIVEGQFDVQKAHEVGMTNIVALGNSSMTPFQFALICRYTKNINLLLDNDDAGEKGRKAIKEKFGQFAHIKDFFVPAPYKDLDEYLKDNYNYPTLRIKKW